MAKTAKIFAQAANSGALSTGNYTVPSGKYIIANVQCHGTTAGLSVNGYKAYDAGNGSAPLSFNGQVFPAGTVLSPSAGSSSCTIVTGFEYDV